MGKLPKNKPAEIRDNTVSHNYYIGETLDVGLELRGNEVKSLRKGRASIKESWVTVDNGELFIVGMHITPWETANRFDIEENRPVKLLARKSEIRKLEQQLKLNNRMTIKVLSIYICSNGRYKAKIALCTGKHNYDKRQDIKERDAKLKVQRQLKEN